MSVTIELPDGWRPVDASPNGFPNDFLAAGPPGYRDYSPTVVLNHNDEVTGSLEEWIGETIDMMQKQIFKTLHVIDSATTTIAEHPALVYVSTFTVEALNVTQEQFALIDRPEGGPATGYVLTFTCASAEYPEYVDTFATMAHSFEIPRRPA